MLSWEIATCRRRSREAGIGWRWRVEVGRGECVERGVGGPDAGMAERTCLREGGAAGKNLRGTGTLSGRHDEVSFRAISAAGCDLGSCCAQCCKIVQAYSARAATGGEMLCCQPGGSLTMSAGGADTEAERRGEVKSGEERRRKEGRKGERRGVELEALKTVKDHQDASDMLVIVHLNRAACYVRKWRREEGMKSWAGVGGKRTGEGGGRAWEELRLSKGSDF
eukprot:757847-Hanusia_phi.AAC.1